MIRRNYPKLTVVTVTYNAAAFVERTVKSVEQQTYANVEHLVVDGASTDGTQAIVERYIERNAQLQLPHEVRMVSERDSGLYDAMNKAIRLATGDYLLFLNAGDRLHDNDTLQRVASIVQANEDTLPAVIYGETNVVDNDGCFVRQRRLSAPERLTWRSFRNGMLVCHQAFVARCDLARQVPYDLQYRFSADFDWCIRLMKLAEAEGAPLLNCKAVVADYLEGGMTTKNHRRSLLERMRIMARHYGWVSTLCRHLYFVVRAVVKR